MLLEEPNPRALDNVNTPEEYGSAMSTFTLTAERKSKKIRVQYFALLREQAGRSDESLVTTAHTPRELYEELKPRYPFSLRAGDAARGRQYGIWRLVAAAVGWRCRGVHPAGCGRVMSREHVSLQPRAPRYRSLAGFSARPGVRRLHSFEGWVRNHNEGHNVSRLEYEAFEPLAVKEARAHHG